jgi:peptide/nickel transport system substrate-binding protein
MSFFKKIFAALTSKERISLFVAMGAIAISVIVVTGIVIAKGTSAVPAPGGDYIEGIAGQPEYVNPVTAASETDRDLVKMIYSNIYDIADKIEVSSDTKTWTVRLKENIHWQDGEQLTSDDVIFTVQEIQNKDANSPLFENWAGVGVGRASELELRFSLAKPYAFFGDNLKNLYILPKHLYADIPPGNWRLSDYNLKPVGSGPYSFVAYEKRPDGFITAYRLKAWDDYFGTKPLIENFDFQFSNDKKSLIKSFNAAQIDGFGGALPEDLAIVGRPHDLFVFRTPSYYAVFLNQSKNPALEDSAVREALSSAIDRSNLVSVALGGFGKPDDGPIPPDAAYSIPIAATTSPDFATMLLDNAGWKIGDNGFRSKTIQKNAVPLAITITVPQIDFLAKTADIIKNAWQNIGAQVTIAPDSPENIADTTIPSRTYEALLFGNILGPSSDLYSFWGSSEDLSPGLNLAMYDNANTDSILESIRENPNNTLRTARFADVQNIIAGDYPAIFLYSPDYLYVTNKSVRGITTDLLPDPSDRFRDVGNWYLNTTRVLK